MPKKKFECEHCGKPFKDEDNCKEHEEKCKSEKKKWFCEYCNRGFKDKETCEEHEEECSEKKETNSSSGGGFGAGIFFFLIILVVIGLLVWGFIGGAQAQDPGITCDMGIGDSLCWQWHKNTLGQAQEFAEDAGNAIKDFFGG